jgi:hypothetical protein
MGIFKGNSFFCYCYSPINLLYQGFVETEEPSDFGQDFSMKMSQDKTKFIYSLCFSTPMSAFAPFVDDP